LGVVTEQFHGGEHSKTSVLELGKGTLLGLRSIKGRLAGVEVSEETVIVDGTNEEEHLGPSESRDGINGGNTVWDIGECKARGNFTRETEDLRDDVSDDAKLGDTAVLERRKGEFYRNERLA
jgi:hypothetical protein